MVVQKKFSVSEILRKGIEAHKLGNFDVAFAFYKVLVDKFPGHPDASHNLGILAIDMGKPEAAAPLIHDAINSKPKYKQYWLSLLSVYRRLNLEIEYKYTVARIRLLFHEDDEFLQMISKESETFLGASVNNVDGIKWKKLGKRLFQEGAYDQLIPLLVDAVYVAPDDGNAWFTLGLCYRAQGNAINAILNFKHSLDIDPSLMVAYRQLGAQLSGITFSKPVAGLTEHLYSLLNGESLVQPKSIARAALSLLKFKKNFIDFLKVGSTAYDKTSAIQGARNIVDEPLFLRLLELCPLPDVAIELTLTNVRRGLLESVSDGLELNDLSKVMSAIGTQCFINEYVYSQSGHESQLVSKLQNQIERLLKKNQQPPSDALLCLSSYVTINELKWVGNLKSNKAISSIIDIQVAKLKVEKDIKDKLITLFDNESRISKTVRQQYEKYPYPRWVQLGASITPVTVKDSVRNMNLKVRTNKILETLNPQVLIAGCGTGQHSIGTAKRLRNSKVTAIDLSKASIAYAKRKSDELKVPNIDYIHCDILQVHKLRKSFDIIETVGVLHHMEDPIEGWKALIRCLRPGGLMKIGLYSDLARQHIVEIRNEIDINHSSDAIDKIRELRALILGSDKPQHKKIVSSPDFYSLSEVVDLILHVQEHRFNIPQINDIMDNLNLEFCGFEDFEINRRFKMQHPNTADLLDLRKWHKFEVAYPDTFARMYQFWCQKID